MRELADPRNPRNRQGSGVPGCRHTPRRRSVRRSSCNPTAAERSVRPARCRPSQGPFSPLLDSGVVRSGSADPDAGHGCPVEIDPWISCNQIGNGEDAVHTADLPVSGAAVTGLRTTSGNPGKRSRLNDLHYGPRWLHFIALCRGLSLRVCRHALPGGAQTGGTGSAHPQLRRPRHGRPLHSLS